jgi:hypothetical protein
MAEDTIVELRRPGKRIDGQEIADILIILMGAVGPKPKNGPAQGPGYHYHRYDSNKFPLFHINPSPLMVCLQRVFLGLMEFPPASPLQCWRKDKRKK